MSASSNERPKWMSPRTLLRSILMLDDTPHSIALGAAIGIFVGLTPTVGVQMLTVLAIACVVRPLFRFNRVAGMLAVYVTNPVTIVPIYWFNYEVGTLFFAGTVTYEDFTAILQYEGFSEWWSSIELLFTKVGMPLLAGCGIVGIAAAGPTYPVMRWLVAHLRKNGPRQTGQKSARSPEPSGSATTASAKEPAGQ